MLVRERRGVNYKRVFVTHCDINYLSRALLLIDSVTKQENSNFYLICDDLETYKLAVKFKKANMIPLELSEIEKAFPRLTQAKSNRTSVEYMYCLTPFVIKHVATIAEEQIVVYLDADTFLFSTSECEWLDIGNESVGITPHRFPERLKHLEKTGKFNVGLLYFRNDQAGNSLLDWWGEKCLSDTSVGQQTDVFGDQLYLNHFPFMEKGVKIIDNTNINLGPWNLEDSEAEILNRENIHQEPILYHFSGLKLYRFLSTLGFVSYNFQASRKFIRNFYSPYIQKLINQERVLYGRIIPDKRKPNVGWWLRTMSKRDASFHLVTVLNRGR